MSTFSITSLSFYLFLLFTLLVYYIIPGKWQWVWLVVVSIVFSAIATGLTPLLFVFINAAVAYAATRFFAKDNSGRYRRTVLVLSLAAIVSQLFLLKYYGNIMAWLLPGFTQRFAMPWASWVAPVGISYFSLSTVSYLLDVYWQKQPVERNPFKLLLFVVYFPALVSGPIRNFTEQRKTLFSPHAFCFTEVKFGMERILWGLFKKMVLADRLAIFTNHMFVDSAQQWQGLYLPVGALLYAFQIYTDFSGCMDIVLGISQMFQISMPENFQRPFLSTNLSQFWRRWHISLGEWSKEYILYPMLKSSLFTGFGAMLRRRVSKKVGKTVPTYIGLFILWIVIGVWHGGSGRYILAAGILPWFFLVFGQILQPGFDSLSRVLKVNKDCFSYRLFCSLRTLLLMCIIWLFALSLSVKDGFIHFKRVFAVFNPWIFVDRSLYQFGLDGSDFTLLLLGLLLLVAVSVLQEKGVRIRAALDRQNIVFRWLLLYGLIIAIVVFGIYGPAYNPAAFIYGGF